MGCSNLNSQFIRPVRATPEPLDDLSEVISFFALFARLAPLLATFFPVLGARLRPALSGRARIAVIARTTLASGSRVIARLIGLFPFAPRHRDGDGPLARAVLRVITVARAVGGTRYVSSLCVSSRM